MRLTAEATWSFKGLHIGGADMGPRGCRRRLQLAAETHEPPVMPTQPASVAARRAPSRAPWDSAEFVYTSRPTSNRAEDEEQEDGQDEGELDEALASLVVAPSDARDCLGGHGRSETRMSVVHRTLEPAMSVWLWMSLLAASFVNVASEPGRTDQTSRAGTPPTLFQYV